MSEIGKGPNLKRVCSFFCLQLSLTKALFYPRFSKFHFFSLEVINQELSESFLALMIRLLNCPKSQTA